MMMWLCLDFFAAAYATEIRVDASGNGNTVDTLEPVRAWMESQPANAALLPEHLAMLTSAAWSDSKNALALLRELDNGKFARQQPELFSALGIVLARGNKLDEAAVAFERAAALPPVSVLRYTSHRRHNLELISGTTPPPQHDMITLDCDIDVRVNLSSAEFASHYVLASRPVVLPLGDVANAESTVWEVPSEGLARIAGDCVVPVVSTSGVVDHQYGSARGKRLTSKRTLADYFVMSGLTNCSNAGPWACTEAGCPAESLGCAQLAELGLCEHEFGEIWEASPPAGLARQQVLTHCPRACGRPECKPADGGEAPVTDADGESDVPYVVFTRSSNPSGTPAEQRAERRCWGKIDKHMKLRGLGVLPEHFLEESSHKRILFAGPRASGTAFHDHSNAFNLLPHGRKQWLLLPPSATHELGQLRHHQANAEVQSAWTPAEWLRRYEADPAVLPIAPLRCTQPAGTALFVPSGWKHAILNKAASVGIAVEVGDRDVIRRAAAAAS